LRQWYPHSERIIFAEPACEGNLFRSHFATFLKEMRIKSGLSTYELTEIIGAYGKVNHGGAVSNWEAGRNTPNRDQYKKICDALIKTGKVDSMPPYENVIRPFIIDGTREFTDVWNFQNVRPYKGKHPAEKPAELLEHAISVTSYPGDIVLDCFAGSGSTAFAALRLGRLSVSIEIDPLLVRRIGFGLEALTQDNIPIITGVAIKTQLHRKSKKTPQLELFAGVK
jgi:site-specific DNA-methyltransferase (adenine-specific)